MLAPSALPKIGLSDWIARSSDCCSFEPDSNAMLAISSAGITAFTCCVAAALLPAPPPGESIGEPPGPPGPPTGDFGIAPAPGASGGGASGEDGSGMAATDKLVELRLSSYWNYTPCKSVVGGRIVPLSKGHAMHALFQVIVIICVLIIVWALATKFSPDPLITKIIQIIIFLVALYVAFFKVLPMAGVSF
jgi:hypothetical protein